MMPLDPIDPDMVLKALAALRLKQTNGMLSQNPDIAAEIPELTLANPDAQGQTNSSDAESDQSATNLNGGEESPPGELPPQGLGDDKQASISEMIATNPLVSRGSGLLLQKTLK